MGHVSISAGSLGARVVPVVDPTMAAVRFLLDVRAEVVVLRVARAEQLQFLRRGRRRLGSDHGVRVRRLGFHALLLLSLLRLHRLKSKFK
ncbi:hypothetical protein QQP08_017336 [Theobroma cacao]|nr:hypothetical protein QQP08_017336 [Theobroma cacao]